MRKPAVLLLLFLPFFSVAQINNYWSYNFNEESSMNLVAVKGHLLARFVNMGLIVEG